MSQSVSPLWLVFSFSAINGPGEDNGKEGDRRFGSAGLCVSKGHADWVWAWVWKCNASSARDTTTALFGDANVGANGGRD